MSGIPSPEIKPASSATVDDINDIFKTLDTEDDVKKNNRANEDDKPIKKAKDDKDTDDEETLEDESEEIELSEDEDDEEKLNLSDDDDKIEIEAPPRKKEILAKFPELFKAFPFLEKIMYRDKQYTELFGSFDDAKELAEKSDIFNEFESQLLSGDTEKILKNVKDTDGKAFNKIVDNYLGSLAKVDKDAYFEVIGNVGKQLIIEMVKEAKESSNEDLQQAALLVNQFLFATSKFTSITKRVNESDDKVNEIEQERQNFIQERFESSRDDLQSRVDNILKSTINDYIDPKGSMTSYIKKNAINDALTTLQTAIGNDTGMRRTLDKLWKSAYDAKFSKESLGKIQSFYLGKAKSALPSAIKKARAEALKDFAPRAKKKDEEPDEETPRKRGIIPAGRPSQQSSKDGMKKGESVADFFARD